MSFIFDEDEIIAGIGFSSRYRSILMPKSTQTRFDTARTEPYFGTYSTSSLQKPTKQESLERLYAAYDFTSEFPKGGARGSLIHELAYVGAVGLILVDPLDRTR